MDAELDRRLRTIEASLAEFRREFAVFVASLMEEEDGPEQLTLDGMPAGAERDQKQPL